MIRLLKKLFGKNHKVAPTVSKVEEPLMSKEELDWVAENGILEMCRDANNWQSNNPNGYED